MKINMCFNKRKIKMIKNIKKSESGRSMVEMLAVLAIIGVLSIGGIAGYVIAMDRWRANEVLDLASKLHVIAMSKNEGQGGDADVRDLNVSLDKVAGGAIDWIYADDPQWNNGEARIHVGLKPANERVGKAIKSIAGDMVEQNAGNDYEMTIIFEEYED